MIIGIDIPIEFELNSSGLAIARQVARLKPVDKHEPDSIFTRDDVREMRERIKELEAQNKHMADLLAKYLENEK